MIKFFRRIRQKLLQENRFSKYLLYAIGEIFLVVIGILIALQINNWNEGKKLVQKEQKLLTELLSNLRTNEIELNESIQTEKRHTRAIEKILALIDEYKPTDSLDAYFGMAAYREQLSIASSSYDNLKTIGVDLIRNDSLKQKITHLFDVSYAQQTKSIDLISMAFFDKYGDFIFSNPSYFKDFSLGESNDPETVAKYQLLLVAKKQWKGDIIKGNEKLLVETRGVSSAIQKYLDHD